MLMFLDYHLYKIQCSLCSVDTNAGRVKPSHPLARFEEKHKDKLVYTNFFHIISKP